MAAQDSKPSSLNWQCNGLATALGIHYTCLRPTT